MELVTLDGNYRPASLVERYSSLIWTERYLPAGDFQLVSSDVERMITLLPLKSFVSIRESTVPMIVESHKIEKPKDNAPVLTVKGRSFESVLDRRVAAKIVGPDGPRLVWIELRQKASDAAYQAIRQTIGDVERPFTDITRLPLPAVAPNIDADDGLPMVDLTVPADYSDSIQNTYEIKPGNLYSTVLELLAANHHGIKAVRPDDLSGKIAIEIYNGADLTKINDPNAVVFDARFDQFDEATYLLTEQGSANQAYLFSKTAFQSVNKNTPTTEIPEPTGLDRRVLYLDVSGENITDDAETRRTRALIELYKNNATALFDGKVSEQVATGYNQKYFLGDIIRLDGEYGLSEDVRVSEFIRSDDSTGSKAYPTFDMITGEDQ